MTFFRFARPLCRVLLLTLLFAAPASAQDRPEEPAPPNAGLLDLGDVLRHVREANPSLRAARLGADALGTRAAQASALPDPTVSITYQPLPVLTARGAQRTQWRLEQPIPFPGKLRLQGEVADLGADVAAYEAEALAADLVLQAKQAYYELYRIQQIQAFLRDFQAELGSFEEVAAVRYEVGEGTQQAVLKAQLEKNRLAERVLDLQERRRRAAETLARLTNQPGGARSFQAVRLAPPPVPSLDAARLVEVAYAERPEGAALDAAAAQADRQVALAQKGFYPDFGVGLTYFDIAEADVPPTATGRDALGVGVSVKVPLQRGRLRAQLEEARLRRAEVEARQEALRTEFRTEIEDLRYALEQEAEALVLYRTTLLPQVATTVEATLAAYTTGRADFLSLLDTERSQLDLRTGYEDTLARYLKTTAALEHALGLTSLTELDALTAGDTDVPFSSTQTQHRRRLSHE